MEIRTVHAEIVADDLLMNVFRLHKLRRSTGSGGAAEIRIEHVEFVTMVEIFSYIGYFMLNLKDNGDIGPHG